MSKETVQKGKDMERSWLNFSSPSFPQHDVAGPSHLVLSLLVLMLMQLLTKYLSLHLLCTKKTVTFPP